MAGAPSQISKGTSTDEDRTVATKYGPAVETGFGRSPSPTLPTLPATTFEGVVGPKSSSKEPLSSGLAKGPEITITRPSSPGCLDLGLSTTPDIEPSGDNIFTKNARVQSQPISAQKLP